MKILLCIDVQNGFVNDNSKDIVKPIINATRSSKFNYIIATQFINTKSSVYYTKLNWKRLIQEPEINLVDGLNYDVSYKKKSYSSYTDKFKKIVSTKNIIKNDDGSYEYVTKGDFNPSADSATAKYDDIIGKVAIKLPGVGKIQGFIATKMGWFIVVLLPALGVIIYDVIKIIKLVYSKKTVNQIAGKGTSPDEIKANKQIDVTLEHLRKSDYLEELNKLKKFNEQE